jgi:hypothetical protein
MRRACFLGYSLLASGLLVFPLAADDLKIPVGGRVSMELLFSGAAYHNTISIISPTASVALTGCILESTTNLPGVRVVSEDISQRGCRVELDSNPSTPAIDPFAADTIFEFNMCAQIDADADCDYVWSSNPAKNSDGYDHLKTTPDPNYPQNIFELAWEDMENLGDADFDDIVVVLRVSADEDGDGLWDDWEDFGIDANGDGSVDLDLPALGANRRHKDMFIEIDYLDCGVAGGDCASTDTHSHEPKQAAIDEVVRAFRDAPVTNPDGIDGINIHLDVSNAIAHANLVDIGCFGVGPGVVSFDTLKNDANNFGQFNPRRFAYHYCIFGHYQATTCFGYTPCTCSGCGELPGNDFLVTLGGWDTWGGDIDGDGLVDADVGTVQTQAGTLMHELGHNLDLHHGGDEDVNYKPNYLSVMNYHFQMGLRLADPDGAGPLARPLDYSRDDLPDLDENNLNETLGIQNGTIGTTYYCPNGGTINGTGTGPINWNCLDGNTENPVAMNINRDCIDGDHNGLCGDPQDTWIFSVLHGFIDWDHIKYDFQNAVDFKDGSHLTPEAETFDVITAYPPVADAGSVPDGNPETPPGPPFEIYTCRLGDAIELDGSGSKDENGTIVEYQWDFPGGSAIDANEPKPILDCSSYINYVNVHLTAVDNDGLKTVDVATVNVTLDAGPDQVLECSGNGTAEAVLGEGLPESPTLFYEWKDQAGTVVSTSAQFDVVVPLGSSAFTVTVTDERGESASDTVSVTVVDTTPPVIESLTPDPGILFPPDHRMVPVTIKAVVSDVCDDAPHPRILSVTSDEADNGQGDGTTTGDWEITGDMSLLLRAERSGNADGRTYTVRVICEDASGNVTSEDVAVEVSHDARFIRGDCDGNGKVQGIADAMFLMAFQFGSGSKPICLAACDVDGDGRALGSVSDPIYLLTFSFRGGSPPPPPFPECGYAERPSDVVIGCETPSRACK